MSTRSNSFPPPTLSPAPVAPVPMAGGPTAFRTDRSAASGSRGTVFISEAQPGTFTLTGEFYPPSVLRAFRVGQAVLSFAMLACLVAAVFLVVGREEGDDVSPLLGVLMVAVLATTVAMLIWKSVLVHSARPDTLAVRAVDIRRVRCTVNYRMLIWWLLIGPLALIPLFVGRRRLRMEMPVNMDGRVGVLTLILLEQVRGDAEATTARLRMSGAR